MNNPHSLEELKISGTKFEPFRRTNCGELLDMSSGDVQPARYHKDVISKINCEFAREGPRPTSRLLASRPHAEAEVDDHPTRKEVSCG
ncbi:hypothetical protein ANN_05475 [Periplaneta americana]|uniref:Uncharacterized protein n=1 Tax=Periplaneta americana TaxID=6978 RepID=A0ABQ8TB01_PERAM|nr:hypothetical protein ANN_05475 [Periplaneta americana]